jgi:hypothetical protein
LYNLLQKSYNLLQKSYNFYESCTAFLKLVQLFQQVVTTFLPLSIKQTTIYAFLHREMPLFAEQEAKKNQHASVRRLIDITAIACPHSDNSLQQKARQAADEAKTSRRGYFSKQYDGSLNVIFTAEPSYIVH